METQINLHLSKKFLLKRIRLAIYVDQIKFT